VSAGGRSGRLRSLALLGLILVPAAVLGGVVFGFGSPTTGEGPGATYMIDYTGQALVVTQQTGRVRTGTLSVEYVTPSGPETAIWVAPNGTGYDNGGVGHPVSPGDQFLFAAAVDGSVTVVWTPPGDGDRRVLEASRIET